MQRLSFCLAVIAGLSLLAGCAVRPAQELAVDDMLPLSETGTEVAVPAYMVFFDFDSVEVTDEAAATLDQLLKDPARPRWTRIIVAGHADRSGSELRNKRLSAERAEAVRSYLVGAGVPESLIACIAFGERRGLVATPDGAVEPQNRRVEIYLHSN